MKIKRLFFLLIVSCLSLFVGNVFALEKGNFTDLQTLINNCGLKNENDKCVKNDDDKLVLKLDKNYDAVSGEEQLDVSKDIVIDLNGFVINSKKLFRVFYFHDADVTIMDSNPNQEHKFDVIKNWIPKDGSVNVTITATLNEEEGETTIKGGCITGGSSDKLGGAGFYASNATVTIEGGNIIGNTGSPKSASGAGFRATNKSIVTMNGGFVSYNYAPWESSGGGVFVDNSTFIMNDGTISDNHGVYGGGVNVSSNGSFTMNGGYIKENVVCHTGGGIAVFDGTFVMNGGYIEENINPTSWIGYGGGISVHKGADITINGGMILKNEANRGAGIASWTGGNIKIYGGTITENVTTYDDTPSGPNTYSNFGGGIFFNAAYSGYTYTEATLTIGGDAKIYGNYNEVTTKEENIYFAKDQMITIGSGEHAPKDGMNVGITMEENKAFTTNGDENSAKYFFADDPEYDVNYKNDALNVEAANYTYSFISGNDQEFKENKVSSYVLEIDGNYTLFDSLEIGELTFENNVDYKITRGSTIITFTDKGIAKLNTLKAGKYEISVSYTNEKVVLGNINITEEVIEKEEEKEEKEEKIVPETRDNILGYLLIGSVSLGAIYIATKKVN